MNKTFSRLLGAVAGVAMLVSCSSSDDTYVLTQYYNSAANFNVFTAADGMVTMLDGADYTLEYDYTNMRVNVRIASFKTPEHTYSLFALPGLVWSYDNSWKTTRSRDIVPAITGVESVPMVDLFELSTLDRKITVYDAPVYSMSFKFADGTSVVALPRSMTYFGTTTVSAAGVEDFTSQSSNYTLDLDPAKGTAILHVTNARFAEAMPVGMNMDFKGITFSVNGSTVNLECDALVPEIGGDPYPAFGISQLKGQFNVVNGATLQFHCRAMGRDYTVDATCNVMGVNQ